jgi:hypothetical protein
MPTCGAMSTMYDRSNPGHLAQEAGHAGDLPAAQRLGLRQLVGIGAVHGVAVGVGQLREVDPPLDAALLRPHDRRLAREPVAPSASACSISRGMTSQALPARWGSMPFRRNMVDG